MTREKRTVYCTARREKNLTTERTWRCVKNSHQKPLGRIVLSGNANTDALAEAAIKKTFNDTIETTMRDYAQNKRTSVTKDKGCEKQPFFFAWHVQTTLSQANCPTDANYDFPTTDGRDCADCA